MAVRLPRLSETEWQAQVVELAGYLNWKHYHTHDSRRSPEGFPDLVLWRERTMFVELKTDAPDSKCTPAQIEVLKGLWLASAEVYVWRPRLFPQVERILKRVVHPSEFPVSVPQPV